MVCSIRASPPLTLTSDIYDISVLTSSHRFGHRKRVKPSKRTPVIRFPMVGSSDSDLALDFAYFPFTMNVNKHYHGKATPSYLHDHHHQGHQHSASHNLTFRLGYALFHVPIIFLFGFPGTSSDIFRRISDLDDPVPGVIEVKAHDSSL